MINQSIGKIEIHKSPNLIYLIKSEIMYTYWKNPKFQPIIEILQKKGPLSVDLISKYYLSQHSILKKTPTTIYRYLKQLESAGFVEPVGRRIHPSLTSSKILYNITGILFIPYSPGNEIWSDKQGIEVVETIFSLFKNKYELQNLNTYQFKALFEQFEEDRNRILINMIKKVVQNRDSDEKSKEIFSYIINLDSKDTYNFFEILRFYLWYLTEESNVFLETLKNSFILKESNDQDRVQIKRDKFGTSGVVKIHEKLNQQDLINFTPEIVKPVSDEIHQRFYSDFNYKSILQVLYDNPVLSLEEIYKFQFEVVQELYNKEKKWYQNKQLEFDLKFPKPLKKDTIYRYLKELKKEGLIVEAGRRIINLKNRSYTQTLYSRVAKLYYYSVYENTYYDSLEWENQIKFLSYLLEKVLNVPLDKFEDFFVIMTNFERIKLFLTQDLLNNDESPQLFQAMDNFGPEQHMVFIHSIGLLRWIISQDNIKSLRINLINCYSK